MDRLEDVMKSIRHFVAERDWEQFHDPKNLAMAVTSEAGELLAEYRWIGNNESDAFSRSEENRKRIAAEIADVGVSLLLLCERTGIDLIQAISEKLETNRKNYPRELAKGRRERPRKDSLAVADVKLTP